MYILCINMLCISYTGWFLKCHVQMCKEKITVFFLLLEPWFWPRILRHMGPSCLQQRAVFASENSSFSEFLPPTKPSRQSHPDKDFSRMFATRCSNNHTGSLLGAEVVEFQDECAVLRYHEHASGQKGWFAALHLGAEMSTFPLVSKMCWKSNRFRLKTAIILVRLHEISVVCTKQSNWISFTQFRYSRSESDFLLRPKGTASLVHQYTTIICHAMQNANTFYTITIQNIIWWILMNISDYRMSSHAKQVSCYHLEPSIPTVLRNHHQLRASVERGMPPIPNITQPPFFLLVNPWLLCFPAGSPISRCLCVYGTVDVENTICLK